MVGYFFCLIGLKLEIWRLFSKAAKVEWTADLGVSNPMNYSLHPLSMRYCWQELADAAIHTKIHTMNGNIWR